MKGVAIVCAVVSFLFFFQIHPNYTNPNELSRLLLVSAIVDDHSLSIDRAIQRFGDTMDKSAYEGKFYCDKPIGYSLLAVPFYWIIRLFIEPEAGAGFFLYLLRIPVNLIPLGLFIMLFHRCLRNHLHLNQSSYFFSVALVFGSLLYPFAQLFLSHILTAICVFAGFCWCCHYSDRKYAFAGGAVLGFGFLLEFPIMIAIAAIFVWVVLKRRSNALFFVIGVGLVALIQFIYNYVVFGHPLHWPQMYMASEDIRQTYTQGYAGFTKPSLQTFYELTFGSTRGLFFFVPHLIFGIIGLVKSKNRSEALLLGSIIFLTVFYYSGFIIWDGGQSFGPRYLVFLIPLLVYGSAMLFEPSMFKSSEFQGVYFSVYLVFVAITIPNILYGSVTYPYPPRFLENPTVWLYITLFWRGFFGLNWGEYLGFSDVFIQLCAVLLVLIPCAYFAYQAALSRKKQMLFVFVMIGLVTISRLLQPWIQANTDARNCFAIGRIGYIQGHYDKAIEFLMYAQQRSNNPMINTASQNLIDYIRQQQRRK